MFLLSFSASAGAPVFRKIGQVLRLSFEGQQALTLSAAKSPAQGGDCRGAPTDDIILIFPAIPDWVDDFDATSHFDAKEAFRPCDVNGRPVEGGQKFELRISYLSEKDKHLEAVTYSSSLATYVDQWMRLPTPKVAKRSGPVTKHPEFTKGFGEFFENQLSWQKVSGESDLSSDINSPALDKFRDFTKERNVGIPDAPIERLPLTLPTLDLPLVSFKIDFEERKAPFEKFTEEDLDGVGKSEGAKAKLILDSLNLVLHFVEDSNWPKAYEAISILEKSKFKKNIPVNRAIWWALKGYVALKYAKLAFAEKDKDATTLLFQRGLDDWREGIRRFSGTGGVNQEYAEYMIVELVRTLFENNLPFVALSTIVWSQKYSWSAQTEERFEYLKPVALERLSLFDEAEAEFKNYFASRSAISASIIHDRRLAPAAAIWPGDIAMKQKQFEKAIKEYDFALSKIPSPKRFTFEKSWYPDITKQFPEILLNRAEASMRLGKYSDALKDLRAFLFVAPIHPFASVAYYRIGDLLNLLEAERDKVENAWRECVFRFKEQAAGPLCQARLAGLHLANPHGDKTEWPRLIADVEDAQAVTHLLPKYSFSPDDVKVFLGMLLADAFLKNDQPSQAMLRLDPLENLNPSRYLGLWYREYRITSLLGIFQKRLEEHRPRDVIAEYQRRQKTLFLYQTRAEVLLFISKAFSQIQLWEEANKSFEQAMRVREVLKRPVNRLYDPALEEWDIQKAIISSNLYLKGKDSEARALADMRAAPQDRESVLRAWIQIHQFRKDVLGEIKVWQETEKRFSLSTEDVQRYAKVLEMGKKTPELRELLERRVGDALKESFDAKIDKKISSELLVKLAELRRASKDYDRALTVLNYLLTLESARLHVSTPRALILYQKGMVLKDLRRLDEALKTFQAAELAAPQTIWGKLSKSNAVEIEASLKKQSGN